MSVETVASEVEYDGEPLTLGRTTYVVPALPMLKVQALAALQRQMQTTTGTDALARVAPLVEPFVALLHAALTRNYPDLPRDVVERGLDLANFKDAFQLTLRVNGFAKGADGAAGNAGAPPSISTGAPSTPASLPRPAGRGSTSTGTSRSRKSSR